jgi:uracil-DNA glycosylase family 4
MRLFAIWMTNNACFDADCRRCPRLARFLDQVRCDYADYFARPVPAFGDAAPRLLIVGLAPGMHGANRTGRPFTGDFAGILLYETLFAAGLSSAPVSRAVDDGLELRDVRITNAVKCLPPANKPLPQEAQTCGEFLRAELVALVSVRAILALGAIAHQAVVRALALRLRDYAFGHGAEYALPDGRHLIDSYHCSRYNTQTKRLTGESFAKVVRRAATLAGCNAA